MKPLLAGWHPWDPHSMAGFGVAIPYMGRYKGWATDIQRPCYEAGLPVATSSGRLQTRRALGLHVAGLIFWSRPIRFDLPVSESPISVFPHLMNSMARTPCTLIQTTRSHTWSSPRIMTTSKVTDSPLRAAAARNCVCWRLSYSAGCCRMPSSQTSSLISLRSGANSPVNRNCVGLGQRRVSCIWPRQL